MAERFGRRRSVAASIRRIAVSEIDAALAAIRDPTAGQAETVRTVRQQLKRLRALIRLPRGHASWLRKENEIFRDLGRDLARTRDAEVLVQTAQRVARDAGIPDADEVGRGLANVDQPPNGHANRDALLKGKIATALIAARRRAQRWEFDEKGFDLVAGGLRRVYGQVRADAARAAREPTPAHFHEWRKQAKYHANQLRLLRPIAPDELRQSGSAADKLAEALGDHHDHDLLAETLDRVGDGLAVRGALHDTIRRHNERLEAEAFALGRELTPERPRDFARRIRRNWKRWRA